MSLSTQNHNFISECANTAGSVLTLRDTLEDIVARWNLNSVSSSLNDADIAASTQFSHLTKDEVVACITAFQAILTALGDNTSGQATNLIKMRS